ncbi:hypothetical protein BCR33DRAFT_714565 [Rhizoclosmatium globosum]|uniref:Transmembrane protein n=1 Tax=Rhizoclosmatium globosum TaxID=329046 RepID=A0A1Y2CMB7_9FUNG|nr:hypothetical protein BCR33DRAFT_714565 [Rhizoclosmatium globosum]|eukprot:ORY48143.1 hypothetical protein BCR33DRAFT_714565 [Rhizoclosmatium globosum]
MPLEAVLTGWQIDAGLVSFGTVLMMLATDNWRVDLSPASMIRWMAYLDAIAFLVKYVCLALESPTCVTENIFAIVYEFLWSWKDACKYAYFVHKALTVSGNKGNKFIVWMTFGTSLILYWMYMCVQYTFEAPCPSRMSINYPVIALYAYWLCVEAGSAAFMIHKLKKVEAQLFTVGVPMDTDLQVFQKTETIHLIIFCLLMIPVTLCRIVSMFVWEAKPYNSIVVIFVYIQMWMTVTSNRLEKTKPKAPIFPNQSGQVASQIASQVASNLPKERETQSFHQLTSIKSPSMMTEIGFGTGSKKATFFSAEVSK